MYTPNTKPHAKTLPEKPTWSHEAEKFEEDLPLVTEKVHRWRRRASSGDMEALHAWSFEMVSTLLHK